MILAIITLITALAISAVAIYYSVAGLVAIFAAAAAPIMIMGGILEVSKLVTAVWLHKYWKQATWWLKSYLSLAVIMLMLITSMGIFGFLSKAHIEQTTASVENVEQIARLETEIARQEAVIVRAEQKIVKAEDSTGNLNTDIQSQIDKEQGRIDSAYTRVQPAIDEQNTIIQTQLGVLEDQVAVYEDEITSLDGELSRLNNLVEEFRNELSGTSVASIEEQVQPYIEQIAKLDADLERVNTQANEYENRISQVSIDNSALDALQEQIEKLEETIVVTTNKLQSTERAKIQEGQAVIGVTSDGLFGGNTRRALAAWVESQQTRIADLQTQSLSLRTQAQSTLDAERTRLTDLVKDLRGPQTDAIQGRKQGLLEAIDSVREGAIDNAKNVKASIQTKIDTVLNTDIPANRQSRQTAQERITALRQADDPRINAARDTIKQLREGADAQISASNDLIQRLRDRIRVDGGEDVDAIIDEQTSRITDANNLIDSMTEEKYAIEAEYRKLEAEVGPIKYIAEFIYDDADKDVLEEAVRWVIILIIFVFDPLAVLLLIASQYTFDFIRKPKDDDGERLRLERIEFEEARAQRIVDNIPPNYDPVTPPEEKEEINDHGDNAGSESKVEEIDGEPTIGTGQQGRSDTSRMAVAREDDTRQVLPIKGEIDARVDQPADSNIQDGDVEHNERDRETNDEESLSGRGDVESTEEQVPNSDQAQEGTSTEQDTGRSTGEIPDTKNRVFYPEELDESKKKIYITKQDGVQIKKKI
jgi:hypothetical protein